MIKTLILYLAAVSVTAFLLYGLDKAKARRKAWRIPEKVLLGIALFGGAPGALLGMVTFRHKTEHWYFWTLCCLFCGVWVCAVLKLLMVID